MASDDLMDTGDLPPATAVTIAGAVELLEKTSRDATRSASKLRKYLRVISKNPGEPMPPAVTSLLREAADMLSDRSTTLHDTSRKIEPTLPPSSRARHARARG